jgi:hypothetical protein
MFRTLVYHNNELLGYRLDHDDYVHLAGNLLSDAFDGHRVQLACTPDGRLKIIDDVNSDAYRFIDDVIIEEHPITGEISSWKLHPMTRQFTFRKAT